MSVVITTLLPRRPFCLVHRVLGQQHTVLLPAHTVLLHPLPTPAPRHARRGQCERARREGERDKKERGRRESG
eukprot:1262459-Rhodomonas_salina.1